MNDLEKQNSLIAAEADEILNALGLLRMLNKYGKPIPWGSYALGLMTWRDLDIYLETNVMSEGRFFELGSDVVAILKPQRMHYRNELIARTPGNPLGLYWGIYVTRNEFPEEWKIDVWAIDSAQLRNHAKQFADLKEAIGTKHKAAILAIKNNYYKHPEYRRGFTSMEIYHVVIEKGIKNVEEFEEWLLAEKGISS